LAYKFLRWEDHFGQKDCVDGIISKITLKQGVYEDVKCIAPTHYRATAWLTNPSCQVTMRPSNVTVMTSTCLVHFGFGKSGLIIPSNSCPSPAIKSPKTSVWVFHILHSVYYDLYENSGNTNKCAILQSAYSFYYCTPTCFGTVATPKSLKRTAIYNTIHTHTHTHCHSITHTIYLYTAWFKKIYSILYVVYCNNWVHLFEPTCTLTKTCTTDKQVYGKTIYCCTF